MIKHLRQLMFHTWEFMGSEAGRRFCLRLELRALERISRNGPLSMAGGPRARVSQEVFHDAPSQHNII